LASRSHERGIDGGHALVGGELEGLAGKVVNGAEIAAGDFVDGIDCLGIEGGLSGAGDMEAVLDILSSLGTAE
jgi:hypothetical protein